MKLLFIFILGIFIFPTSSLISSSFLQISPDLPLENSNSEEDDLTKKLEAIDDSSDFYKKLANKL